MNMELLNSAYSLTVLGITIFLAVYWLTHYVEITRKYRGTMVPKVRPKVAVIIPILAESADTLRRTVASVIASGYPKYTIYMILNKSSPKATRLAAASLKDKNVKMISAPMDMKSKVMNYAIKKFVKEEFILVLDADTIIDKDLPDRLLAHFRKNVGAVVSTVWVYKPKKFVEKLQRYEYLLSTMSRKALSSIQMLLVAHGAGSMFRRSALERVGYFDENNYTEDLEMGLRLLTNGYRVENAMYAVSYTVVPQSFKALFYQRLRWFTGFFYNINKYRKKLFTREQFGIGFFGLPMIVSAMLTSLAVLVLTVFTTLAWILPAITLVQNTSLSFFVMTDIITPLSTGLFGLNSFLVLSVIAAIVGLFAIYYSLRAIDARLSLAKDMLGIAIYIIFYSYFLSIIWIWSFLLYSVRKRGVDWIRST